MPFLILAQDHPGKKIDRDAVREAHRATLTPIGPKLLASGALLARQLGLKPCHTPMKRPQSNGISEPFTDTLTRDRVHITPLQDAVTILGSMAGCFEECRKNHPHSGLKRRSSRKFIAAHTETA